MGNVSRYEQNADAVDHLTLECGAHGYSRAQIAACVGVSKEVLARWVADYPRYAEVMERAHTLAQAWWEGRAMDGTAQSRIGGTVWHKSVAARFPHEYADRQEIGPMGAAGRASEIKWNIVDPKEPET